MGDFANTVGTCSLGMHNTLWDSFTGKMSKLVNQVEVSDNDWTLGSGS
jgi:hypothetical protein